MQDKVKLSEWAEANGKTYRQAWELHSKGELPVKTTTNKKGSIFVLQESKASENKEKQKVEFAAPLFANFGEKIESKASVRRNRSSSITPTDQYKHIEEGLDVFTAGDRVKNNNDSVSVSEAIRLVRKCYYNFSDLRNICDTLVEFSSSPIYYRGGSVKSRKFFEALFNKVGILNLQQKFFMEYYRSCNVFPYRFESILKDDDINTLNKTYGTKAAKGIKLPAKYVIIDPSSVIVGGNISFSSPLFYQRLNSYEVQRLIKPITQEDKDFLNSLPEEVRKNLNKKIGGNQLIDVPLDPDYVYFVFYKKADYEPMASPLAFPVLRDINAKEELKRMDLATARTTMRAVLHIAMGFESKGGEIFIDQKAMEATRLLFESESIGKVLVTDFTTKVEWKIPDISKLLGPEKYKQLNDDIRAGLNNILVGTDEKFANQSIKVKLFIQRLKQSREVFLNEFLIPEIKRISKLMNFKGQHPIPYFQDLDFKDSDLWNRIITSLYQMGALTATEATRAIEDGVLPDEQESIENQREFKKLKDEGLFQSVQGNPSTQAEILDIQNKQAMKTMEKQQEFDSKEKGKDRKHAAENPQSPAPQIVLNAPTKMAKPVGKPSGTRSTSPVKKKVKPISAALIKENLILASQLNKELEKQVLSKYKVKKLTDTQIQLKDNLLETIMMNEQSSAWLESTGKYLSNPDLKNEERFNSVLELGKIHQTPDYLSAILFNSQGQEIEIDEDTE